MHLHLFLGMSYAMLSDLQMCFKYFVFYKYEKMFGTFFRFIGFLGDLLGHFWPISRIITKNIDFIEI